MSEPELFKKMYFLLFNAITDALDASEGDKDEDFCKILREAQIKCEEIYISSGTDQ